MQALLRCYRWDWKDLRAELPGLARAWLPCDPGDLTGPGIAVDETAQLKDGDATACVAPQHAGCTGHVENCVTTVFPAWVATSGHTALAALAQLRCLLMAGLPLPGGTERQVGVVLYAAVHLHSDHLLWDRDSRRQAVAGGHLHLNPQR